MLKRKTVIIIFVLVLATVSWWGSCRIPSAYAGASGSGWIPDRLIYTNISTAERRPSMATDSNGYLYAAYEHYNSTTGRYEIFISTSIDGGETWSFVQRVYNPSYDLLNPSTAIDVGDGNNIFIAFELEQSSTNHDVYIARRVSGAWSVVGVDTDSGDDRFPSITSEYQYGTSDYQYISWEYVDTYNDRDLMFAKSTDDGATWTTTTIYGSGLNYNVYSNSSITNAEGYIYIAYRFGADYASTSDIRVTRSSNFGSTWTQYTNVESLSNDVSWPSIVATHGGGRVVVAFQYRYSATDDDIYYSYSTDYGATWSIASYSLASSTRNERTPTLAVDGSGNTTNTVYGYVHATYWDNNAIKYSKALYTTLTTWSTAQTVNNGTTVSTTHSKPAITTHFRNGSRTYYAGVAWTDSRGASLDVYYSTSGATYTLATSPTGLTVTVDGTNYTAPQSFNWVAGYNRTISTPSPQSNYYFVSWSDGGARSHKITVGTTDTTLTATLSQYPNVNLRTKDWAGNVLPSAIVNVAGIGNRTSGSTGWANFTGVPPGTYTVNVYWRGSKVNQTSVTITTSNRTIDLRSRVYSINFANAFKDSIGNTLYTAPSSFKLTAPNGTTTQSLTVSSYYLQNGTFRVSAIIRNSTDITPSPSPTFDPTYGNPSINTNVPPHLNTPSPYDWPMFHQNLGHTGTTSSTAPMTNTTLWTYTTGGRIEISSPTIAYGRVYIGSEDDKVYAFNATSGSKIWEYTTGGNVYSSSAVEGGRVFLGSFDGNVYCLNATTGTKIWSYLISSSNPPRSHPVVAEGRVFVSANYRVYALNATSSTATLLWSYYAEGNYVQLSSPAVAYGRVYVGAGNYLYVLNATTTSSSGQLIWKYNFGTITYYSSPAIYGGRVYIGSGSYVYALNATTSTAPSTYLWRYLTGSTVWSSPAIAYGRVYVGSHDYYIYALNATTTTSTGQLMWRYQTGSYVYSSPAVAEGRIYVGSHDNKVYSLNATSSTATLLWSYKTGSDVVSSPSVSGGKVFIGSYDGKVYAFGTATVGLNLRTLDWSGSVLPSSNVTVVGVGSKTSSVKGWANFTLQSGTYTVTVRWQGSKVNQTTITVTTSNVTMDLKSKVYSLTLSFKDNSGNYTITPTQFIIEAPNGTQRTLTTYTITRAQNGTWTIRQIKWQGSNVVPSPNPSKSLTSSTTWTVNSRVYPISFANAFKDSIGNTLYIQPSNFTLACPNGTALTVSDVYIGFLLQNGTYTVRNITRLGEDLTPIPAPTFDPTYGTPAIYLDISPSVNMEEPLDWPMFHQNPSRSGESTSTVPDVMSLQWTYTTGGTIYTSSPAVVDGRLYVGSYDYSLYALNASTGKVIWSYKTGGYVYSSPAVVDGIVYFGSSDSYVYALNATTKSLKWKYNTAYSVYSSPTIADGKVYIADTYYVYCLNATTGSLIWSKYIGQYMYYSSPSVGYGMVYIGAGSYVYALNASTGGAVWNYYTGDTTYYSSPAIYDGMIYINGYSNIYALDAKDGTYVWKSSTGTSTYSSPAVADGKVYYTNGYYVYSLDAYDGGYLWDYYTGEYAYYSSPAIADGKVYVGAGNSLYALNASDGGYLWRYKTGSYVYSSPAVADERVYVGSYDSKVYAFGPTSYYSLTFKFMDNSETDDLTRDISWVIVQSPTGKILNLTSNIIPQAEAGKWTITKIVYMKTNVVPTPNPAYTLTSDYTWTINSRIYTIDFTNSFKDIYGNLLGPKPDNFTLLWPYGKEADPITPGNYYLQNGTWTWKSVLWEGSDVTPSYTVTFDPTYGNPTINLRVYKVDFTNRFQDQQGRTVSIDSFLLICPNGTTTKDLSVGSYPLQIGTFQIANITWQDKDVTPSPLPEFNPSTGVPTIRLTLPATTTISASFSSRTIDEGSSVTVTGTISPSPGRAITNILVQFILSPTESWKFTVSSDSAGRFQYTWTPPKTGTYQVAVSWPGDDKYLAASWSESFSVSARTGPSLPLPPGIVGLLPWVVPPAFIMILLFALIARRRRPRPAPQVVIPIPPPPPADARVMTVRRALERLEAMRLQGKVSPQAYQGLRSEYEAEIRDLERRAAERRG